MDEPLLDVLRGWKKFYAPHSRKNYHMIKAIKGYDTMDCFAKNTAVYNFDYENQRFPISLISIQEMEELMQMNCISS